LAFDPDRRAQDRYNVSLAGEIIWNGGAQRHACSILDLSLDGARIDTGTFVKVPETVFLLERGEGQLFECQVRWQTVARMGLFFIDVGSRAARRALIKRHAASP
jgi:hypothetical protein